MKVQFWFHSKGGKVEITEDLEYESPLPHIKEEVFFDKTHQGIVFNVIHLIPQKEIIVKIR